MMVPSLYRECNIKVIQMESTLRDEWEMENERVVIGAHKIDTWNEWMIIKTQLVVNLLIKFKEMEEDDFKP